MIEKITNKNDWNEFLKEVNDYDFYHTYDYHELSINKNEDFFLLKYTENDIIIGLPLIIRKIEKTDLFDITSVYGYAGPISINVTDEFDNSIFKKALFNFLKENNIVSVFNRLNPFIQFQKNILCSLGECMKSGDIVNIDITNDLETQRKGYQRRIKSQINKARRLCNITKATTKAEILKFIDIYYENMDRVNAEKSYYFNKEYFINFLESNEIKTDLLLVSLKETNEIIAGAMFVKTNSIVQYHLSGTKEDYLEITPVKLLIDEMRLLATEQGYKYFNLGGGLSSENDSLLRFKLSFSKELTEFCVWKYIVDKESYNNLISNKEVIDNNYFPAYRQLSQEH
jgi:lipid II:glycine glycyltransferase (peptidoglycan interpeptide bridge formation enzyme)